MTASLATGSSAGGGEGSDGFSNVEVLDGGPYDDTLTGDAGDNSLWGAGGNDTLSAGDGNDFLVPGSGNDVLDGGAGHDAAAYWDAGGPITADLGAGTATGDGPDSFSNVEQIHGSEFGDTLNAGTYVDAWLVGNDGNDSVTGGPGNDFVFGDAGNDTVLGGGGNDGLNGWTGDDRLYGEAGNDYLDGADGIDFLDGGPDSDYCVNGETVVNCEAPARVDLALGKQVRASNETPENPAWLAVDGNWFSYWSSGNYPPQWIEVDLGAVASVGEIDLGITQLPDCPTIHRIYGRATESEPYRLLYEFDGFTVDQQVLRFSAGTPQQLRFIRVETTSSASWVGWRELEVYGPGG